MVLFDKKGVFSYETFREGEDVVLMINCEEYPRAPSIEDDPMTMSKTM